MLQQLLLYFIAMNIRSINGSCSVTRIIMRVPRENDIGLIFDLTVSNRRSDKSEMLDFTVSSDDICTLNMTSGEQVQAGTIFGGDFGCIEPGNSVTVSLVWPTVSLYNRVGSCPITVSSANHQNDVVRTKQILYFDTRFEILDPENHSFRRRKDFTDCKNWDKNYFLNCTALNCEERYFGKRSFYNRTTEQCEPVPTCFGEGVQYDFYGNECVDTNTFITEEDIEQLKQGQFDNNYLDLQEYGASRTYSQKSEPTKNSTSRSKSDDNNYQPSQMENECNVATTLSLVDFNNCFQHLNDPKVELPIKTIKHPSVSKKVKKKSSPTSILRNFYYDWYMPLNAESKSDDTDYIDDNENTTSGSDSLINRLAEQNTKEWVELFVEMLLIILLVIIFQVVVTVLTYALVCIVLYGFLELLAGLKPYKVTGSHLGKKLTPRRVEEQLEIMTSASLLSQLK